MVRILDLGHVQAEPFIAMELLEGHTFAELRADGRAERAAGAAGHHPAGAHRGLPRARRRAPRGGQQGAASCSIVHRDFTPDNIHVGVTGEVKVIDFGIAKSAAVPGGHRARHAEGQVLLHVAGDDRRPRRWTTAPTSSPPA